MTDFIFFTMLVFLILTVVAVIMVENKSRRILISSFYYEIIYYWKLVYRYPYGTRIMLKLKSKKLDLYFDNSFYTTLSREFTPSLLRRLGKFFSEKKFTVKEMRDGLWYVLIITYPQKEATTL